MRVTELRSYFPKDSASTMRHITVGTPPIELTFSRSIVSIAWSGSNRPGGMSTSFEPPA